MHILADKAVFLHPHQPPLVPLELLPLRFNWFARSDEGSGSAVTRPPLNSSTHGSQTQPIPFSQAVDLLWALLPAASLVHGSGSRDSDLPVERQLRRWESQGASAAPIFTRVTAANTSPDYVIALIRIFREALRVLNSANGLRQPRMCRFRHTRKLRALPSTAESMGPSNNSAFVTETTIFGDRCFGGADG